MNLLDTTRFYASLGEIVYREDYYPTFYFNITFEEIQVPTYGQGYSNFTLQMNCLFIIDVNRTTIKLETLFDLTNFTYFSPSTYLEPAIDTPFSISVYYDVMAFNRTQNFIMMPPSFYNTKNISYNLGSEEYQISTLYIEDTFLDIREGSIIEERNLWCITSLSHI